jgi:hypothetical protein
MYRVVGISTIKIRTALFFHDGIVLKIQENPFIGKIFRRQSNLIMFWVNLLGGVLRTINQQVYCWLIVCGDGGN